MPTSLTPPKNQELDDLDVDVWLLGVLLTPQGYQADAARAALAARTTGTTVLLANHAAPTGGWDAAGGSGVWSPGAATAWRQESRVPNRTSSGRGSSGAADT